LLAALESATGTFFTGGDQMRVTSLLGGTPADRALHRRHEQGMVLRGTSAGASMMSGTMSVSGASEATPRLGQVRVGPGMEFMHGAIIDQHFGQRGRSGRLLSALAQYPHLLGIGIDEDTARIVRGEELEVIGAGAVTVLDAGSATYNDVSTLRPSQHVALCGVTLHVLTAGLRFNLQARAPIPPAAPPPQQTEGDHETPSDPGPGGAQHLPVPSGPPRKHRSRKSDRWTATRSRVSRCG
jgi:cyanophycinase